MRQGGVYWRSAVALIVLALRAPTVGASDDLLSSTIEESKRVMAEANRNQTERFLYAAMSVERPESKRRQRFRLDVEPLVADLVSALRDAGIPLRRADNPSGGHTLGVAAAFRVNEDLPAVSFHIADRSPEPFGAFYSRRRGLSWAFIWPLRSFTIRIEGGDDSEFGYFAIAGAQWRHSTLPLSAGIGMPMKLRDAEGDIGVILQLRAKLY